jgi:1-acyl-sn-glycerol-3-phosphate acyltransferase
MAKSDIFEKRLFAEFFTRMNAFPVVRKSADRKALRYALKVLEKDLVLGIFPEGRRVRDSESVSPVDGLAGVGFIARASGADVLPSCLYREPGDGRFRPKVVVIFGKVIKNADLGFGGENKSKEARNASELIMNEIKALWNKAYEGESNED